jgi:hypothetical protein
MRQEYGTLRKCVYEILASYCNKVWYNFHAKNICDEILSWMIEILMKNILIMINNRSKSNIPKFNLFTQNGKYIELTFSVGDIIPWFIISIDQDT